MSCVLRITFCNKKFTVEKLFMSVTDFFEELAIFIISLDSNTVPILDVSLRMFHSARK